MKKRIELVLRLLFLFVFVLGQTPVQNASASPAKAPETGGAAIAATASIGHRWTPAAPGPAPDPGGFSIAWPEKFKPGQVKQSQGSFKPSASAPASVYSFFDGADAGSEPDLVINPITAYNLIVDSNVLSPSSYGPNAATLGAQYCNNTTSTMTDVWAYIGDYTGGGGTPGVYPQTNPSTYGGFNADFPHLSSYPPSSVDFGDPTRFYALEQEAGTLPDDVDATRYLGNLAAGECRTVYWLVSYPRKAMIGGNWVDVTGGVKPEDDLWLQYDFWGRVNTDYSYYTRSLTMRNEISAMANKIWPNGDNKVPQEYVDAIQQVLGWDTWTPSDPSGATMAWPGETVTSQGIWYDLGVVGAGFDNNYDLVPDRNAWVQPIGDSTSFDPGCFNLVRTYGLLIVKLNEADPITGKKEKLIPFVDRMYFDAVEIPENNIGVVGLVFYEYLALDGACSASLTPYQEVASGFDNEKFNGDFGAGIPPLTSQEPDMTFVKSGPGMVATGTTYSYTLTFTLPDINPTTGNFSTVTIGNPSTGRPLTYYDAVPVGLTYVANSASTFATMTNYSPSTVGVTRLFSINGGSTWTSADPGNYTSSTTGNQLIIQWLLSSGITSPSTGAAVTGQVSFQAQIPGTFPSVLVENTACMKIYNADSFVCDDHDIPKPGNSAITGIAWKDDGTGGAAGISGNAIKDGTEAALGSGAPITVWLYWDGNGDGDYTDAGDFLVATAATNSDGAYCFGGTLIGAPATTCLRSATAGLAATSGSVRYIIVVDTADPQIPTGYGPSTPIVYKNISLAAADTYGDAADASEPSDFGFVPALSLAKVVQTSNMTTNPPTALVDENVKYTISLYNQIPGSGAASSACSYNNWASVVYPTTGATPPGGGPANSQFQLTNNLLGAPDNAFSYSVMGDNTDTVGLSGYNMGNLYPGGNPSTVQVVVHVNEKINLAANDRFFINIWYNDVQKQSLEYFGDGNWKVDGVPQTPGTIFTGATGSDYTIVYTLSSTTITGSGSWSWNNFVNNLTELQLQANKGTNNGEVNVDAAGFIITTDAANCGGSNDTTLNPVPLTDAFSSTYFDFVSADPPISSSVTTGGVTTLTWNNLGPILPGGTRIVTVYLRPKATGGTTLNYTNTATSTDSKFASGFPANSPVSDTAVIQVAANSNTRTLSGRVFDDNPTAGWLTTLWTEADMTPTGYNASDGGIPYIEVDLYGCFDRNTDTLITTEGANKQCGEQGGSLGGEWRHIRHTYTSPYKVIDGKMDINNDGSITTADDGTTEGCTVTDGLLSVCSTWRDFNIISGYIDADRDGTTSGDTGDDLEIGSYIFGTLAQGYYRVFVHSELIVGSLTADVDQTLTGSCNINCDSWSGPEYKNLDKQVGDLDNQTSVVNVNFGYNVASGNYIIGDYLFYDWDGDGIQDAIDEPMYNVTVRLFAADGLTLLATTTTDINGYYCFGGTTSGGTCTMGTGYPVGYYTVRVLVSSLLPGLTQINDPSEPHTIIDGLFDLDGGGVGASDDGYVAGVRIINGAVDMNNDNAITSADDGTLLNYPVKDGYFDADRDGVVNPDTGDDLNTTICSVCDNQDTFALTGNNLTKDFAYQPQGSGTIGDTVWVDTNGDGLKAVTENGIPGVTVKLQIDLNGNGTYVTLATKVTDANGAYLFSNLPLGSGYNYRVILELDSGNLAAIPNDAYGNEYVKTTGTFDAAPTPDIIYFSPTITSGSPNYLTADFGFAPASAIGDTVYQDVNLNGTQDFNEPGIPGATVSLYTFTDIGNGNNVWNSGEPYVDENGNNTHDAGEPFYDADGRYQPGESISGSPVATATTAYQVINGFVDINNDGSITTADDGSTAGCTVVDGKLSGCSVYASFPVISSYVDADRDGVTSGDTGDDLTKGFYLFTGLTPNYYVVVVTPPGTLTGDPSADGDACSTIAFQMRLINSGSDTDDKGTICDNRDGMRLFNGTNYYGADFGYQLNTGSIGDTLWIDSDNDGLRDVGEAGIDNVTVWLCTTTPCNSGAAIQTKVTDANGNYTFNGLGAGTYYVAVDSSDGDLYSGLTQTFEKNNGGANDNSGSVDAETQVILADTGGGVIRATSINGTACSNCDLDVDFGYRYSGSTAISGTICFETTNNGFCGDNNTDTSGVGTGETAYASVVIYLYKLVDNNSNNVFDSGDTTILVGTTTTSAYKVIDGLLDVNHDGSITSTDDGTVEGCTVTDGVLSGCATWHGFPVIGGYIDINRNGTTNPDTGDDFEIGDYSFGDVANGQYYVISVAAPNSNLDLTSTQSTVNAGGDDASTTQLVETVDSNGDTVSAYQTVSTVGDTNVQDRDFAFQLRGAYDFGDLPQSYSTTFEGVPDGPRHKQPVGGYTVYLGSAADATTKPDTETNGQPTSGATGDGSDETGVTVPTSGANGAENVDGWADGVGAMEFDVVGAGWLIGWIDFNRDGDFADLGEMVISRAVTAGQDQLFGITTQSMTDGALYARFRLFTSIPALTATSYAGPAVNGEVEDYRWQINGNVPTPVTLAYFLASGAGGTVNFTWSTATELGNVGFNLYVADGASLTKLNGELIASHAVDSLNRQDYSYSAQTAGDTFYIEDVDILGNANRYGPFKLGEASGSLVPDAPIDWAAIQAANAASRALTPDLALDVNTSAMNLVVRKSGLYRVTYEALRAAGYDLAAVSPTKLKLSNRGAAVPIYVKGGSRFGPGSYFEFYGQALDTAYTDANIYKLEVIASGSAARVSSFTGAAPRGAVLPASFTETLTVNNQRAYASFYALEDGWYDTSMLAYTASRTWNFPFDVPGLADTNAPATLNLVVWGVTDWPQQNPDHHLVVSMNGVQLASELFNGLMVKTIQVTIPAGTLHAGANTLQLTLPGDTGVQWDMVNFDKFSLTYQRTFAAKDGQLTFTANGKAFKVTNLPTRNVVVYRLDSAKNLVKMNNVQVTASGSTFTAAFAGNGASATYYVSAVENLYAPALEAARVASNALNQPAQYLIIAHPAFISGLQPLVQARQAQGLTVNVVDVNDVYAKYSYGVFDPQAIKQYIAYAKQNLGTQYILLVGGDTYDYRNYLGRNSVSFIPSLFGATGPTVKSVPMDPLYADVNNDNVPDIAIGRFPVRTAAELDLMIAKTLAYQNKNYRRTAVFASDMSSGVDFRNTSLSMISKLPANWTAESISLDDLLVPVAQTRLLAAMNRGTALVTFTGHSGTTVWTYSGLFNTQNAANLTNAGRPFVAVQWGCWNIYHIDPVNNYLVQALLFSGDKGAAAVLGSSTLTSSESENMLGQLLTPRLVTPGTTIGQALQQAKAELALTHPELADVLLGWSLMGDPALVVEP